MIAEIGHFALILACCVAVVQSCLPILGAARGDTAWMAVGAPAARGQFVLILIAFCSLGYPFAANDFSVQYVAANSNSMLPLPYRLAAIWGGHEGSLLLWALILSGWMVALTLCSAHLPRALRARILGVMGLISLGFLLFMLTASNPFERLVPPVTEGRDLNPLLQDPGMVFHPPMLYMGYVGFSVTFAFAIAALLAGKLDATWARWSRPWTMVAWVFLTLGIALGSNWAYYELGWGGWWFWDPVENASFMPWLVGTALIHSLAVTDKRGGFRVWTVLLAILAFSLSLLGTFLVRSGVLTSVHAFATDPERGLFILGFLTVVSGGSLALFAWRAPRVRLGGDFDLLSRETSLLANNVLLVAAAGSVMLGTLYPLFLDALGLGKISVGPPYFDTVMVPLMVPAFFLMGIGPLARWKKTELPALATRLRWALGVSVATGVLLPFALGHWTPLISLGVLLAVWILAATVAGLHDRLQRVPGDGLVRRLRGTPRAFWGMALAHCGVAVFILGVTLVKGYEVEKDLPMQVGNTAMLGGYAFRFDAVQDIQGANYVATRGTFHVSQDGRKVVELFPEKRVYTAQGARMTEAAIDPGLLRDLYVSLGDPIGNDTWTVRLYHKPFVDWIWGGCVLMALGGVWSICDRRYRPGLRREEAPGQEAPQPARAGGE